MNSTGSCKPEPSGPDTLVWHSGLANWLPYSQARAATAAGALVPAAAGAGGYAAPASGQVICSECRQAFPPDEVVQIEGLTVCGRCKPIVLQKLREGVRPGGAGMVFAGFWIRFVAVFIDGILVQVIVQPISYLFVMSQRAQLGNGINASWVIFQLAMFALVLFYEIFFIAQYGATLGKMACGIQVVRADGSKLTWGRSTGRYFAKFISGMILLIGYIMAAFDREKRALHDQICDTRVIKKNRST